MLYLLDLIGTAIFALSGALITKRARLDLFGVVIIGLITAIGGGTIRDLLLGRTPVFWIQDPNYIIISITASVIGFVFMRQRQPARRLMLVLDAMGLSVFTIIGVDIALSLDTPLIIAPIMGMITGTFGGLIRDTLLIEIPLILRKEIYATAALLGAVVYVTLTLTPFAPTAPYVGLSITLTARLLSLWHRWSLPTFEEESPLTK